MADTMLDMNNLQTGCWTADKEVIGQPAITYVHKEDLHRRRGPWWRTRSIWIQVLGVALDPEIQPGCLDKGLVARLISLTHAKHDRTRL